MLRGTQTQHTHRSQERRARGSDVVEHCRVAPGESGFPGGGAHWAGQVQDHLLRRSGSAPGHTTEGLLDGHDGAMAIDVVERSCCIARHDGVAAFCPGCNCALPRVASSACVLSLRGSVRSSVRNKIRFLKRGPLDETSFGGTLDDSLHRDAQLPGPLQLGLDSRGRTSTPWVTPCGDHHTLPSG